VDHNYIFNSAEPTFYVELYLPKLPQFQGFLYDTLTKGFVWEEIESHFNDDVTREKILFKFGEQIPGLEDSFEKLIPYMKDIFQGYSLYEVDGVFKGRIQKEPISERTQVVRLLFKPDYVELLKVDKSELEQSKQRANDFFNRMNILESMQKRVDKHEGLDEQLHNWVLALVLFVYGYIILSIANNIESLEEKEEEIWCVSFLNPFINRVELVGGLFTTTKYHYFFIDSDPNTNQESGFYSYKYRKPEVINIQYCDSSKDLLPQTVGQIDKNEPGDFIVNGVCKIGPIEVEKDQTLSIEIRPGHRLDEVDFDLGKHYHTIIETEKALLYWFSFHEDGVFELKAKMVADDESFFEQLCGNRTDMKLRKELFDKSLADSMKA
jgi:hypothetical protein